MIVELVAGTEPQARSIVVTADRELRQRCQAHGATVLGPRWLLSQLG
jgi:8-oxo-dGTP diphosphatase